MTPKQFQRQQIRARLAKHVLSPAHTRGFKPVPVSLAWNVPGQLWAAGHHTGEDHACAVGNLATSVTWGKVVGAGWSALGLGEAYGNIVVVQTPGRRYWLMYCHLSRINVRAGNVVTPGKILGYTGDTGHTTGPHLHFEVRPAGGRYGSDVNPNLVKVQHR